MTACFSAIGSETMIETNPEISCLAETHVVENVPPPLEGYDSYARDLALREAVQRFGGDWAEPGLTRFGLQCGSAEWIQAGRLANENRPRLHTHDRYGHRVEEIEYHPAYHRLMERSIAHGLHALPWNRQEPGSHVARAAFCYLQTQVEAGHLCPITMTFACLPTLNMQPELAEKWRPGVTAGTYDPRNVPYTDKQGLTLGMGMTEKQGGSDVRSNSTRAAPVAAGGPGGEYELTGHKFFLSAPMSDAFLMLAQSEAGLSCFLVPRWRPDGSRNGIFINQLKDKMGNVSNASCETDLRGATGWMIGEEGRGVANIIEMVALTRFDCTVASAAGMRQALVQAAHHCRHRRAFGELLERQPLMQNVLADLALEAEAATWLGMRLAAALDRAPEDESETLLVRIGTAVGKYWNCKRAPGHAFEAMECVGGSGVMETTMMPRLYREAPVNAIWEGSGNIQCLDVLRAIRKTPTSLEALLREIEPARGEDRRFDRFAAALRTDLAGLTGEPGRARELVERLALAWQGALLIRAGNEVVSDAFCATRLDGARGRLYGALPGGIDSPALIERAWPAA
jgi:putative acyl-CoA dehydrogenase